MVEDVLKCATWNIFGKLTDIENKNVLKNDLDRYKIDICCLQETYHPDSEFDGLNGSKFFCFGGKNAQPKEEVWTSILCI